MTLIEVILMMSVAYGLGLIVGVKIKTFTRMFRNSID